MRYNKYIAAFIAAGVLAGTSTSCSESFLDEDLRTGLSTDYFQTQEGLDDLVTGAYQKLKFKFNYIWAIECYNMGTDEFTDANNTMPAWNHYSTDLNSSETAANQPMWDNMYGLIEPANLLIQNIPQYYNQSSASYNTRLGEAYFMRAYAYFELVKQFGGVPIKLVPSTGVETTFSRNSEEEVYAQIIADFKQAYDLLPTKVEATGRISKWAAAHFLAKAHLFRASEAYDSWNSSYKTQDLNDVITYGKEVIAAHPLCKDFVELWDFTAANSANEKVSEVVLAAQFSDDQTTWGRFGNQMHLYYPSVYQDLPGTKRDISGGREFSYVSATEYTMQVFDRVNDSRFWKSFITNYGCNDTKSAPTWTEDDINSGHAPAGAAVDGKRFVGGEVGLKYIVNNPGDTRYSAAKPDADQLHVINNETGKFEKTHTYVRYFKEDGNQLNWATDISNLPGNYYKVIPHKRSVALSKFRDGYRVNIASQFGTRDAIIARSADDVLMVAEAYIRQGDYTNALTYLNMVRDRAGYADGEDRSIHVDGGQAYKNNAYCSGKGGGFSAEGAIYYETNTYYESNNIAETTAATKSDMHLNSVQDILNSEADQPIYTKLGCSTDAQKVMCFLLNERTRELIGESQRWEDLARTRTLNDRWHAFNDGVSRGIGEFNPAKHYYRPIPQSFLDGITNENGQSLSNEEKAAMQNPGY